MQHLENEKDIIQKISNLLVEETLTPAKDEAKRILADANDKAKKIIEDAEVNSKKLIAEAHKRIQTEQQVFHNSLEHAVEQSLESLRQKIQNELFNTKLADLVDSNLNRPAVIADIINSLVEAIRKSGLSVDLEAFISDKVSKDDVNKLLSREVLNSLKNGSVTLSRVGSGVELKMLDKHLTIDVSGKAVEELLASFIRKDLRDLLFKKS